MLVKHIHQWDGKLVATLVATDKHKIGISVVHPNDAGNKNSGLLKAKYRAETGKLTPIPNRVICTKVNVIPGVIARKQPVLTSLYDLLMDEVDHMEHRSVTFFSKNPATSVA